MLSENAPSSLEGARGAPRAENEQWRAVLARDRSFDGRFVFAVRTTGIYCRPSCPAKRPRRDRTSFYRCPADAERAGFRACLRCEPRQFAEAQDERRLDGELALARAVQECLTPTRVPAIGGWEVAGLLEPAALLAALDRHLRDRTSPGVDATLAAVELRAATGRVCPRRATTARSSRPVSPRTPSAAPHATSRGR